MAASMDTYRARIPAYYCASIREFVASDPAVVLGKLTAASDFDVELPQRDAWQRTILLLGHALADLDGTVALEYDVPRLGSRIDVVVVAGAAVLPIEFKVGETGYHRADYEQAWDYGLDLKNFHRGSHEAPIFPILVATESSTSDSGWQAPHADGVRPPFRTNAANLAAAIKAAVSGANGAIIDGDAWARSPYHPTPTIIEAARALYARHDVRSITRNDAGARNLGVTSLAVERVVARAREAGEKAIVFVTGVPGAGKTLVGLNLATERRDAGPSTHAVYLSGNGPLVAVLREALTRDELHRRRNAGHPVRRGEVEQAVKPFIQNVHHFRDEGVRDIAAPPIDRVVIFDEAQRAWDQRQTATFMRRRRGLAGFDQSEPEFLMSYMNRHRDWAVIVCLVGGGQEIHTGESGIGAWLEAARDRFPDWRIYVSPQLTDAEYMAGHVLDSLRGRDHVVWDEAFHLSVSMRSFRSERVSAFVKALLDGDVTVARDLACRIARTYPIAVTRKLSTARQWIRDHTRGSERSGLVASSNALRLKPHAIDVRVTIDPVHWFLNPPTDTRASSFLEDAATEFQVQGLELDWTCVTWDADLRRHPHGWSHHMFRGDRWTAVHQAHRKQFQLNAYRVLLTRARQGFVVFVPEGSRTDETRAPEYYDETFEYLRGLGLPEV